ncbi:ABC transporter permease [Spiroplasma culicicola]|uniref:Putative ABC transporter n=1 Tax=Spiroplasma culicicola AES-1 TaxID=1276246 RepID=W6A8W7_9MOLU|nr:ABC transporter permease [Spiroplasma culicicola]AHI53335.1 putative ABC transporter [Spiroplasma culicicola AES-1]
MKKIFKGFVNEFQARVCSSWKRLIKFIAILFVPILYAVTCILAFWNPVDNLGKAPVAILNGEQKVWVYKSVGIDLEGCDNTKNQSTNKLIEPFALGVVLNEDGSIYHNDTAPEIKKGECVYTNTGNYRYDGNLEIDSITQFSLFEDLILPYLTPNNPDEQDLEKTKYSSPMIEDIQFTNIKYIGPSSATKEFKNKKDYIQLYIPDNFSANLIGKIGLILRNKDPNTIEDLEMQFWTTFERNFVFGYYLSTAAKMKDAIIIQGLYKIIGDHAPEEIIEILNLNLVNFELQGLANGLYGIGLGQFFIAIGLYVGTLMQTFIYDRAKRTKDLNSAQYFFSKTLLMYFTGMIQVTLLVLVLALTGFNSIGFAGMFSLWLWLLFVDFIFVLIIQTLWFSFKDETVGKFLIVIYMVLNLAAGWGTFPSFMQFDFFYGASFITIFTYAIHAMGSIIYGIGSLGFNTADSLYILQQAGILLIFIGVFITIALFVARKRMKEMYFGTSNPKYVSEALLQLGLNEQLNSFRTQKTNQKYKYHWKNMKQFEFNQSIKNQVNQNHPFEGQFKWFKQKEHDPIMKPNESDEDIMKRNDDISV